MTNNGHTFTVGQTVTYIGGRVKFKITAVDGRAITMVRLDGKDDGNATTVSYLAISRR